MTRHLAPFLLALAVSAHFATAQEPALPAGLGGGDEADAESGGPPLPTGLGGGDVAPSTNEDVPEAGAMGLSLPFPVHGFFDVRAGDRLQDDPNHDGMTLAEARLQLAVDPRIGPASFRLVADFLYDDVQPDMAFVDWTRGHGWLDLREANVMFSPLPWMDVKAGRQILTWGTGDQLFINDNFPKDWRSFFAGRHVEYLKAPSDALKASLFFPAVNLDIVYTPQFDPDRFIDGTRNSYHAGGGVKAGEDNPLVADIPDDGFEHDELAARLYRNLAGVEAALYGYWGYWKSPGGRQGGEAIFPELHVYGASVRGVFAGGIANVEIGLLDSRGDRDGTDPTINNSEWRALLGYERDLRAIASDFTIGLQYYLELMADYGEYKTALPAGQPARDEDRHVLALRLTKLMFQQNLTLSFFTYYSPSDEDAFLRPRASYEISDAWEATVGANVFLGEENHTFFGQFEDNTNIYAAIRYSF